MFKNIILIICIILLVQSSFLLNNNLHNLEHQLIQNQNNKVESSIINTHHRKKFDFFKSNNELQIYNLTDKDVCYHGIDLNHPFEWWYFDGVLTNNYSFEFHINIGISDKAGIVVPMLNLYDESELIYHAEEYIPISKFNASNNVPVIYLNGKKIIEGSFQNNKWSFTLNVEMKNCTMNVTFNSTSTGWKSNILDMWWYGVIQPRAKVSGIIKYNGSNISVNGTGFHEHAWQGRFPTVKGWYWGKFVSTNFSIIWAQLIKYPWEQYTLMVLNEKDDGYKLLSSSNISIDFNNFTGTYFRKIPTSFQFTYKDNETFFNAQSHKRFVTHQRSIGIFNYWRYHVRTSGRIRHQGIIDEFDNIQIMDFTRFW